MTTNRTITHDGTLVLKFPPRRDLVAGACLNAGTRISTRDGPETLTRNALIKAVVFTGDQPNSGEWVIYYSYSQK